MLVVTFLLVGCKKEEEAILYNGLGTWEIEDLTIEYLNAVGNADSSAKAQKGFYMFYNTPSEPPDVVFLMTCGITYRGVINNHAYYYSLKNDTITLQTANAGNVPRKYFIKEKGTDQQTWQYIGPIAGFYFENFSGNIRETVRVKRLKY